MVYGEEGAVRCFFPCTAYDSKAVHPPLVAKTQATICSGNNLRIQDRGYQFI